MSKKRVLLKITGEVFLNKENRSVSAEHIAALIEQIKQLKNSHQFGIVVGGGNFFRGSQHGKSLGLSASVGHQIGMLATMMNGLILNDLLEQNNLPTALLCAMPSPEVGKPISQQTIMHALKHDKTLIFTGGTGNPFFTTDTNAVLRALQMSANETWKGTGVDGVYDDDPRTNGDAQFLKTLSFRTALDKNLGIMDNTAYALAEKHGQKVRVFNIFTPNSLMRVAHEQDFGSKIQ